jgi:hypothetical protein
VRSQKMPMAWHEGALENMRAHLHRERMALERQMANVERLRLNVAEYARKIMLAKKKGVDAFDPERFGNGRASAANSGETKC